MKWRFFANHQRRKGFGFEKWTEDGRALLVARTTPWEARMYRVDIETGKRTHLQTVTLSEKAVSVTSLGLLYAANSKTYVYDCRRILGTLYVVEGLE